MDVPSCIRKEKKESMQGKQSFIKPRSEPNAAPPSAGEDCSTPLDLVPLLASGICCFHKMI